MRIGLLVLLVCVCMVYYDSHSYDLPSDQCIKFQSSWEAATDFHYNEIIVRLTCDEPDILVCAGSLRRLCKLVVLGNIVGGGSGVAL